MSEYRIRKFRKTIELYLAGQEPLRGAVFLSEHCRQHHGPERVFEFLTSEEPFFPFETKNEQYLMIHRSSIQKLVVDSKYELELIRSYGSDAMITQDVTITLTDGSKEKGALLIEPRAGASRAIDELNRERDFILLDCGDFVQLIHVGCISLVNEGK